MEESILVVDDDQLIRYGLEKAFREKEISTTTAATAEEALRHLNTYSYNLCLLDADLPDLNCLELVRIIHEKFPQTRIMLMTAGMPADFSCSDDLSEAKDFGVCHLISKPFELKELMNTVMKTLEKGKEYYSDVVFAGAKVGVGQREHRRMLHIQPITFFMSHIDQGEARRASFSAVSTDIGGEGVGLLTQHPVQKSDILSFDESFQRRSGVVVWSHMVDGQMCRAGVKFA